MRETKALLDNQRPADEVPVRHALDGLAPLVPYQSPLLLPIRSLGVAHRARIARHLLALDQHDRYLRFGFMANDEQIQRYADSLNFERDDIFGIYNRRLELIAMAHLAFSADRALTGMTLKDAPKHESDAHSPAPPTPLPCSGEGGEVSRSPTFTLKTCAEFGVSVLKSARARGYGGRLFDRAATHARNEGVSRMLIHALSENTAMLKIARNAGATLERDGAESEAHLLLPPATLDSRLTELLDENLAQADYRIKVQVKQFRDILSGLQARRRGLSQAPPSDPK